MRKELVDVHSLRRQIMNHGVGSHFGLRMRHEKINDLVEAIITGSCPVCERRAPSKVCLTLAIG